MRSFDLKSVRAETNAMQRQAASPLASAWVSANAGTGKTYVLVQRVLRLMLSGTPAERILCLTFTKAAASEMANRLFRDLSGWAIADNKSLQPVISELLGRNASEEDISRARHLFALSLETPGGLKVQTIHAFCERLLQRFPLEAGVAPHFAVLDAEQQRSLTQQAIDKVLTDAAQNETSALGKALKAVIGYAGDTYFDDVLREALSDREWLVGVMDGLSSVGDMEALEKRIRARFTVGEGGYDSEESLIEAMAKLVDDAFLGSAIAVLEEGKKSDVELAGLLRHIKVAPSPLRRVEAMGQAFLTKAGEAKKDARFVTTSVAADRPDVAQVLRSKRDQFAELTAEMSAFRAAQASAALMMLASAVMQSYSNGKSSRAALDFDDLIVKTSELLGQAKASAWVLYKLDGGIDHILVDEAQDTSPHAWDVIETLADEFFAGVGARTQLRTVFAVGDEKQSIYGFQGAAPEKFAQMGGRFSAKAAEADVLWHPVPLNLSFRSTVPVLQAVDGVFGGGQLSGLTAVESKIQHFADRIGQAGVVEIWDTDKAEKLDGADPWEPLSDAVENNDPKGRVAERIADQIKEWLDRKEPLHSHARPIRPGDILILVRKRMPFAPVMIAALKARNIAVAGADRIKLTDQLAVMDLMALGDFLLMPEDDLALANVLKSPLFDLNDDDLFKIGHKRENSLWEALAGKADNCEKYSDVYSSLRFFLARSDLKPPYEFFESLLDGEGRRIRFVERLGPEAADAIDEFLNLALTYDDKAPPSLQGFMTWLRDADVEIKRDMEQGRDEVRVMTVHGAKGLEANIVFMPDTCSTEGSQTSQAVLRMPRENGGDEDHGPLFWAIPSAKGLPVVVQAREQKNVQSQEEYHRLLYVAMTRARDRLYICGFETKKGRSRGCWYDLVRERLEGQMTEVKGDCGALVLRLDCGQDAPPDRQEIAAAKAPVDAPMPAWATSNAPSEPVRVIPVSPSTLLPLDEEHGIEEVSSGLDGLQQQAIMPPRKMASDIRFLRGRLTHALLEHLPGMDRALWDAAAHKLVKARGSKVYSRVGESIVAETLNVLRERKFASLFGPESMAEVPITARVETDGAPILITGSIDRLAVEDDQVLIVDYKTNRPPPEDAIDVADAYLMQLAAYRLAIHRIYAGRKVICAILWTDGPRMMEIPADLLDQKERDLLGHRSGKTREVGVKT